MFPYIQKCESGGIYLRDSMVSGQKEKPCYKEEKLRIEVCDVTMHSLSRCIYPKTHKIGGDLNQGLLDQQVNAEP